jgi:uncharacterized RDD family membrane protein YckC
MTDPSSAPVEPIVDLDQALAPGLARRLAALFYDGLLLAALLVLATALATPLIGEQGLQNPWSKLAFQGYLVLVIYLYYAWHWSHGGQTLGMRAWRLRALRSDGHAMGWGDALKRFAAAGLALLPLGLGLIWCLFDRDGLAWHDRLSASRLVLSAKRR